MTMGILSRQSSAYRTILECLHRTWCLSFSCVLHAKLDRTMFVRALLGLVKKASTAYVCTTCSLRQEDRSNCLSSKHSSPICDVYLFDISSLLLTVAFLHLDEVVTRKMFGMQTGGNPLPQKLATLIWTWLELAPTWTYYHPVFPHPTPFLLSFRSFCIQNPMMRFNQDRPSILLIGS